MSAGIGIGIGLGLRARSALAALRAARRAVLADAPILLYYADAGLTPASPSIGGDITGWADQSGNGKNLTFDRNGVYGMDGAYPYMDLQLARNTTAKVVGNSATGPRVCRFVLDSTAAGQHGILSIRAGEIISIHAGTTAFSNGSNVMVSVNASWFALGVMQNGKHCYEVRFDPTAQTAQLFIDGAAAGAAVTIGVFGAAGTTDFRVIGSSTSYAPVGKLFGYAYQDGAGTDAQMLRWNAMSKLAWGTP